MLVTISGLPGSGTTTVSKLLVEHYSIDMMSAGDVFRALAKERGMTLAEFGKLAESDPSIDTTIDQRQCELACTLDNAILEGRLAGHMAKDALTVWIKAPPEVRVGRIVKREGSSFDARFQETMEREASEALRYKDIHGIDIDNISIYDIIIDSSKWDQFQIASILTVSIDNAGGFA